MPTPQITLSLTDEQYKALRGIAAEKCDKYETVFILVNDPIRVVLEGEVENEPPVEMALLEELVKDLEAACGQTVKVTDSRVFND